MGVGGSSSPVLFLSSSYTRIFYQWVRHAQNFAKKQLAIPKHHLFQDDYTRVKTPADLSDCGVFQEPIDRILKPIDRICAQEAENGRSFGVPKIFYLWVLRLFEVFYLWVSRFYGFLKKRGKKPKTPKK